VVGTAPEVPFVFRTDIIGEHARWHLTMRRKRPRWPWWDFRQPPDMRLSIQPVFRLSPVDRLLGAASTAWLVGMGGSAPPVALLIPDSPVV
jgi:hypothetical protein